MRPAGRSPSPSVRSHSPTSSSPQAPTSCSSSSTPTPTPSSRCRLRPSVWSPFCAAPPRCRSICLWNATTRASSSPSAARCCPLWPAEYRASQLSPGCGLTPCAGTRPKLKLGRIQTRRPAPRVTSATRSTFAVLHDSLMCRCEYGGSGPPAQQYVIEIRRRSGRAPEQQIELLDPKTLQMARAKPSLFATTRGRESMATILLRRQRAFPEQVCPREPSCLEPRSTVDTLAGYWAWCPIPCLAGRTSSQKALDDTRRI